MSQIYSSCENAYRLTETGNLNLPPEYVDPYCSGPCLAETHLVLDCIENIMKNFVFYNKATIQDVRDTIKAGCSYGPERGNFDVSEHLQAENNNACNSASQILLGLGFMFAGPALLL
ncbi:hypothetical protein OIU78_005038 [Salix suchowensis]|nr:hypothetical protein OIU78_005038 [Salix suchowensis]